MRLLQGIFSLLLCTAIYATPSFAAKHDCDNQNYRKSYPKECANYQSSTTDTTAVISGVVIVGAGLMLTSVINTDSDPGNTGNPRQPTIRVYDTVGYTDPAALSAALSDPSYDRNFEHYNEIRLAYSIARGFTGKNSTIAVLDTGDYSWHGTAVAGIVGDAIASDAVINAYKIVDAAGDFVSYAELGDIINTASDADIFNASWGIPNRIGNVSAYNIRSKAQIVALTDDNFIQSIINAANRDAIFVWAAGNDGASQSNALAAMPRVIPELDGHFINVVAWDTATGQLADYSNQCGVTKLYCITAPGSRIDVDIGTASGTSFAAPMVSGAIAVIQEAFPYMTASEITQLLFVTARDLGADGVDEVYGWGMLDLERATRPVGAVLVPLADGMQPLAVARASGAIGHSIRMADLEFTFFDSFGRAFDAKLNDSISFTDNGRAFERLRGDNPQIAFNLGKLEFGFANENLLASDGFLQTGKNNLTSFLGYSNKFMIRDIVFFQNIRFGVGVPSASKDSFISGISNIYSASAKFSAKWRDWTGYVAMPTTIIGGNMNLHLPVGRNDSGKIAFADYNISLGQRPSTEYSIGYKFLTASFIENDYGRNEFFIMVKTSATF